MMNWPKLPGQLSSAQQQAVASLVSPSGIFAGAGNAGNAMMTSGQRRELAVLLGLQLPPQDTVPELQPTDWLPYPTLDCDAVNFYGFDPASIRDLKIINKTTRVVTTVTNPWGAASSGVNVWAIWCSPVPGTVMAAIGENGVGSYEIWRSPDYGASWTKVLTLGSNGTIADVRVLSNRNFCAGQKAWYIGEYNINGSRTPGGANDAVTLHMSTDQGMTWTPSQTWNTGGSHILLHIHAVKSMGSAGVLILAGDSGAECGMILWNEEATIGNVAWASLPVPAKYGDQRYRAVDCELVGNTLYWMADAQTETGATIDCSGLFSMPINFSSAAKRIDGKIGGYHNRAIYYSTQFSNGSLVFVEAFDDTPLTGDFFQGIWITNEARTQIERAGAIRISTAVTGQLGPMPFMQSNGSAYLGAARNTTNALGKSGGTCAFRPHASKRWSGVHADTVHPVYWVDPTAGTDNTDTNRGYYPGLPWATVGYALASSRTVQGGRVMFPAGVYTRNISAAVSITASTTNASSADWITIDGEGRDVSVLAVDAASSGGTFFQHPPGTPCRVEWKDITLTSYKQANGETLISGGAGATVNQLLQLVRARLGGYESGAYSVIPLGLTVGAGGTWTVTAYDSIVMTIPSNNNYLIPGTPNGLIALTGYRSAFHGGKGLIYQQSTEAVKLFDCCVSGYAVAGISIGAAASVVPQTTRTRFHSIYNVPQLVDSAGLTLTGKAVGAMCTQALSPSAWFDSTSVIDKGAAPRDPYNYDFSRSDLIRI